MEFEKYIPKRVVKDISPEGLGLGGQRALQPGDCIDALNCRYYSSEDGNQLLVESIRGNSLNVFNLPAGDNKSLGAFLCNKVNSLVFCIYNSTGEHRVLEWSYDTKAFTILLQGASLNFSPDHYVSHGGIIDDIWIFNDGLNLVRKINLVRARAGLYSAPYQDWEISLMARPPLNSPTAAFFTDVTSPFNYISADTFQFAYRYVYLDGEQSVFSPLSLLMYRGEVTDFTDNTNNVINVTVTIPAELVGLIRTVEVASRAGNLGNYFIFKQIQSPNTTAYTVPFSNADISIPVSVDDQIRLYDAIPARTDAFGLIKNHAFVVLNDIGFDVPETFNLTVSLGNENYVANGLYLKQGGSYNVGIVFSDNWGRTTFVKAKQSISIPFVNIPTTADGAFNGVGTTNKKFLNWVIGGTPPAGFNKYQIVLSRDEFHGIYTQCLGIPHLYISATPPESNEGDIGTDSYIWRGRKWKKIEMGLDASHENRPAYKYVYLQLPINLPATIDNSYFLKVIHADFSEKVVPIIAVEEDFAIVDLKYFGDPPDDPRQAGVGAIDWQNYVPIFVEIFRVLDTPDERFFEVSAMFDIVAGNFSTGSGRISGDTYTLKKIGTNYKYQYTPLTLNSNAYTPPQAELVNFSPPLTAIESPSGLYSNSFISVETANFLQNRRDRSGDNPSRAAAESTTESTQQFFGIDYNKIASSYGRVHIENNNEKKTDQNTSVLYSDPFYQNTLIFGLNTFRAENKYDIPRDRSPIRVFKKASQILLAIHERNTSSLYIGEGLIRQGNDFVLAKSTDVIGDNRELELSYGCINPESVLEVDGHVWWWDAYKGAVVRYTNEGLFAVSNYGLRSYFYRKGKAYEPYRNQVKIVTGYDHYNEEFLITFPAVANTNITAETWCFSPKDKSWTTRFSFVPESYASLNNNLFSFKNGAMWWHHQNSLFNNFYGQQYTRFFDFISNPKLGKDKRLLNIHIKGDIANDLTGEFKVVQIFTKEGQQSFIPAYEFSRDQGKYVAPVLKDINTPNIPAGRIALRSGDDMVSNYFIIRVENDRTDKGECAQVNVVFKTEEFSI